MSRLRICTAKRVNEAVTPPRRAKTAISASLTIVKVTDANSIMANAPGLSATSTSHAHIAAAVATHWPRDMIRDGFSDSHASRSGVAASNMRSRFILPRASTDMSDPIHRAAAIAPGASEAVVETSPPDEATPTGLESARA